MKTRRHNLLRPAFSLLEATIGVTVLGIGMIMLASIFPVALTQHRESLDQARALDLLPQAVSMIQHRLRPERLWYDAEYFNLNSGNAFLYGTDAPWMVMPLANIDITDNAWSYEAVQAFPSLDYMLNLTDQLNSADVSSITRTPPHMSVLQRYVFHPADMLSDAIYPVNDIAAEKAASRLVWYGFYRQMANGTKTYGAAICKQRRGQQFYIQNVDTTLPEAQRFVDPIPLETRPQRLPVPWRVTVARAAGSNTLYMSATNVQLADLAPRGSKIMIHGAFYKDPADTAAFTMPAGRILTVGSAQRVSAGSIGVDIIENIDQIPDISFSNFTFDVWVFPPASTGAFYDSDNNGSVDSMTFDNQSPLLTWKVPL